MISTEKAKDSPNQRTRSHHWYSFDVSQLVSQKTPKKSPKNIGDSIDGDACGKEVIVVEDRHEYDFEVVKKVYWIDVDND